MSEVSLSPPCLVAAFFRAASLTSLASPAPTLSQRIAAEAVLKTVQEHPQAWSRVDAILERSASPQSKFFALQVRERERERARERGR